MADKIVIFSLKIIFKIMENHFIKNESVIGQILVSGSETFQHPLVYLCVEKEKPITIY